MNTGQSIGAFFLGLIFIVCLFLFVWLLVVLMYRLAVRVVAGAYPSVWNAFLSLIGAALAVLGIQGIAILLLRTTTPSQPQSLIVGIISFIISLLVLGTLTKLPTGEPIGVWKAFFARIVEAIMYLFIVMALGIAAIGLFGRKALSDAFHDQATRVSRFTTTSGQPFGVQFTPSPTPAGPAPSSRGYLKNPIDIKVPYGDVIIPAGTAVTLVEIQGDSYRVQSGANTFTVSQGDLTLQQ